MPTSPRRTELSAQGTPVAPAAGHDADCGMSRFLTSESETSGVGGTPAFMAPEAFDGARSAATDVWSVGILAHLLLTGKLPFPEREWASLFKAILTQDPPPLPAHVPEAIQSV